MVGGHEPTAPEPIQVDARGIFQTAEEVRRLRSAECPSVAIFSKREVKELATKDRFTQDVQSGTRFGVSIVSKLTNGFGVRHDGNLFFAGHERHDVLWVAPPGWVGS